MQHNTQVPVGKHNNRQHASPHHEVATDVKQMPIRTIIIIIIITQKATDHLRPALNQAISNTEADESPVEIVHAYSRPFCSGLSDDNTTVFTKIWY